MMKVALIPNDFSQDLEKVFQLCKEEGVKYVELARAWGKSILDMDSAEIDKIHNLMKQYNLEAASIQTQIMKVFKPDARLAKKNQKMHRDFDYNISMIDRAIELALDFDTKYIVTYSFFTILDKMSEEGWQLLIDTYKSFLPKLEKNNITLVIECEGDTYIQTTDTYLRLFKALNDSPYVRVNLDLSNLLAKNIRFTQDDFDKLSPYVEYFHVKDRAKKKLFGTKSAIFGEGNRPWKQTLGWFKELGWKGFLSIEPHIFRGNRFESGRKCVQNLQSLLKDLDIIND